MMMFQIMALNMWLEKYCLEYSSPYEISIISLVLCVKQALLHSAPMLNFHIEIARMFILRALEYPDQSLIL